MSAPITIDNLQPRFAAVVRDALLDPPLIINMLGVSRATAYNWLKPGAKISRRSVNGLALFVRCVELAIERELLPVQVGGVFSTSEIILQMKQELASQEKAAIDKASSAA